MQSTIEKKNCKVLNILCNCD